MRVKHLVGYVEVERYGNRQIWSEDPALLATYMLTLPHEPVCRNLMKDDNHFGREVDQLERTARGDDTHLPSQVSTDHSCFRLASRTDVEAA